MTAPRLAACLAELRSEFNAVWPHRDHGSDGWIADAAHALRVSDHNPDSQGVVHAIDVDVDGVPMAAVVAYLTGRCRAGKEARLHYVIHQRTIWSSTWGWVPRRYTGLNPHTKHAHFSCTHEEHMGRSATPWGVADHFTGRPAPAPRRPGEHPAGRRVLRLERRPMAGDDVRFVQHWIGPRCGQPDGVYGPQTFAGVRWYQHMRGITSDGVVGPVTWRNMGIRASP